MVQRISILFWDDLRRLPSREAACEHQDLLLGTIDVPNSQWLDENRGLCQKPQNNNRQLMGQMVGPKPTQTYFYQWLDGWLLKIEGFVRNPKTTIGN